MTASLMSHAAQLSCGALMQAVLTADGAAITGTAEALVGCAPALWMQSCLSTSSQDHLEHVSDTLPQEVLRHSEIDEARTSQRGGTLQNICGR